MNHSLKLSRTKNKLEIIMFVTKHFLKCKGKMKITGLKKGNDFNRNVLCYFRELYSINGLFNSKNCICFYS